MSSASPAFGHRLKAHRERRGIALAAIADTTKIKKSLLEELERNDPAHWPRGIFRRSFMRAYALAVGLPADETVREFLQVFPEDGNGAAAACALPEAPAPLRLTLAADPSLSLRTRLARVHDAVSGAALVVIGGFVVSLTSEVSVWAGTGMAALVWYPITTAAFGDPSLRSVLSGLQSRFSRAYERLTNRRPKLRVVAPRRRTRRVGLDEAEALPHPLRRMAR